ncbi:hypothetical protein THASP1DRAFT_34435 [Thamnocephalis sphaerospora]|uniref:Nudix hydrolase domain-containing protein n=1 Tax=Thamnocephalis sphaerospora TaxID=78915 RepID=A0A4P9XT26_9FUNG|nr:hypothetical protein THASP1DRAFT_34435 [Thamnocephalis sphaerospora]|eukprot:RKP09314.1 hypothetical protein THASP1DRAFT_34435 [Thamnocephalis sphaerospora]
MSKFTLLELTRRCDCFPYTRSEAEQRYGVLTPLVVDGQVVGLLLPDVVQALKDYCASLETPLETGRTAQAPLLFTDERVGFAGHVATSEERSALLTRILLHWRKQDRFSALRGWRNELYPAYLLPLEHPPADLKAPTAFVVERAGAVVLGMTTYGVHLNIYTRSGTEQGAMHARMWVARRSATKPTWPGYLDNAVAGGIPYGHSVRDAAIKECMEEASLPAEWAAKAKMVGAISYFTATDRGLAPEVQFVCDLELPDHITLMPNDGEVVIIDFMLRHGFIDADTEPGFLEIQQRLHRRLDLSNITPLH